MEAILLLLLAGAVAIQDALFAVATADSRLVPVVIYGGLLVVAVVLMDGVRVWRRAQGARERAALWMVMLLAAETLILGIGLASGRAEPLPGPLALHLLPLALAGGALWMLCAPREGRVAAGSPLPFWIAPLGALSALALEVMLAAPGRADRMVLPKVMLGRGLGELALLLALCVASRLPGGWRTLAMPLFAAMAVTLTAILGGSSLLLTGHSLDEGLWLVAAGGAIFGVFADAALERPQRSARAVASALGYFASAVPLTAGAMLAGGAVAGLGQLPHLLAFSLLHGLLFAWATAQSRVADPLGRRRISVRWPPSLRRAVALTVLIPWLWAAILVAMRMPREAHLIVGAIALAITLLCAAPALVRTPTARLWMYGQLVIALPVAFFLAFVTHHDLHDLAVRMAIAGVCAASFWLAARAARHLGSPEVRLYFGLGGTPPARAASRVAPALRGLSAALSLAVAAFALPAAMRSANRWHLAGAPMALATAAGPDARIPAGAAPMPASRTGSALALDARRETLYLADGDRGELVAVDAASMKVRERVRVGAEPTQLVLGADGTVFATVRGSGDVVAWTPAGELRRARVGTEPWGLARSDDGATLYVSLASDDEVVALGTRDLAPRWRTAVAERPRALAVTPKGDVLVGHVRHPALSVLDGSSGRRLRELPLVADGHALPTQAWAFAGAGDALVVFHAEVQTGVDTPPAPTGTYGGGVTEPMVARLTQIDGRRLSILDVPRELGQDALDFARLGRLSQPVAATYLPASGRFAVVDLGGERVHLVAADREDTIPVPGGPAALAADAARERLYVWTAFDRELRLFGLGPKGGAAEEIARASLGPSGLPELAEQGRRLFHRQDGHISGHGMACASCHPEGREDGLTWRLEGSRRQTPSLAGRLADTAPYNWVGSQPTLEGNLAQTIQRLGGTGLSADEIHALATYISDYLPAQRPRDAGRQDALVQRGAEVFRRREVGCAGCHVPATGFTDGLPHELGTTRARELRELRSLAPGAPAPVYETPSLRFISLSAPYLHDGSARTLDELLRATDGVMGHTGHLPAADRRALVAYLESL